MQIDREFLYEFFAILNKKYNYAVLRGYEELPDNFKSHDIDILIPKNEYKRLKKDINHLLHQFKFQLLLVNENERFHTIVIAKRINNELQFLYIDFFFNYSLYGVELLDANTVLNRRVFNKKVYHVLLMDEFLEKYLNTSLLNVKYPEKYKYIYEDIFNNEKKNVESILSTVFDDNSIQIETLQQINGKKMLIKAFIANIRNKPLHQLKLSISFVFYYLKGVLFSNGFSFSMTGPDGSGKTTLLTELEQIFSEVYREVKLYHFRPTVIPRIAELFKKSGLKKEVDENYDKPHRGGKTSKASSWFRLFYYILDYIIGYYKVVKPVLFRRGVVIFDRYYTDIISDSKRSRIYLNYKTIFMLRKLVPSMDYNFIIFVDPEKILQRKQELTREQIDDIYEKLNYICKNDTQYTPITNDNDPQEAVNAILDHILEKQDIKYRKYFK